MFMKCQVLNEMISTSAAVMPHGYSQKILCAAVDGIKGTLSGQHIDV